MLRLSKLTDYAVVVLVRLSRAAGVQTSPGIAATTGIPEPTVAKVLKTLAAGGLVASQRGARGGYRLHAAARRHPGRRCDRRGGRPDRADRLRRGFGRRVRVAGPVPDARTLGPGERGDPAGAEHDHPGRHAGGVDPAGVPRAATSTVRCPPPNRTIECLLRPQTLDAVQSVTQSGYKWGFETDIEMDLAPKGLNEDIIRLISSRKEEPAWLLEWRLKAYRGLADR